jgi:L-threonylcarbamoyladenylate synthase
MKTLPATEKNIKKAAMVIKLGGVVIYPTETVYGFGCAPMIPEAAKRICLAKGRANKPLPLACSDTEAARHIVEFNSAAIRLAERFWPGPLMLVLPAKVEYSVWVTHGAKTLGVRVPDHRVSLDLAKLSGGVIVSTSANISGEEPAITASEAFEQLGDKVDLILDDGPSSGTEPSTVVDLRGVNPWILRKGPITAYEIKEVLLA